jgi:hypothetical protein
MRGMNLSPRKAEELSAVRCLRSAVQKLVKEDLAWELQIFFIVCYAIMLATCVAIVVVSKLFGFDARGYLLGFFVPNCIYLCFLMALSLVYEVYIRTRWFIALAVTFALGSLTWLLSWLADHASRTSLALVLSVVVIALIGVGFTLRTPTGKRWLTLLARARRENETKGETRSRAEAYIRKALGTGGGGRSLLRWLALRSVVRVAYSLSNIDDPKGALEEFVRRHRFKEAMGRLGAAVFIAYGLCHIVVPIRELAELVSLGAKVVPVYALAIFLAERFDEARDELFADLLILLEPTSER